MKECVKCFRDAIFKVEPNCTCREIDYACGFHLGTVIKENIEDREDAHVSWNQVIVTALKIEDTWRN